MQTFPQKPMAPILQGMNPQETENWLNAHNWAYSSIVAALKRVQDSATPAANDYAAWLETETIFTPRANWERRRNVVIDSLTKMATRLSTVPVIYKKSDDASKCLTGVNTREAYSEIDTREKAIGLCALAFDDHHLRAWYWDSADWARALIVVHETYHTAVDTKETVATADSYYVWSICYQLPFWNPELAVRNAQNYAYFVMGSFWRAPTSSPGWLPDYGIWNDQTAGGAWGSAADSPAAAAMTHTENLVMVAYREPAGQEARLRYRILLLNEGREVWLDPMLFRSVRADGSEGDCRSLVAPALAAHGREFYCAYIDPESKKVMFAWADASKAMDTKNWSDLHWRGFTGVPDEIAGDPLLHPSSMSSPSPALAVYRPDSGPGTLNQSAGIYCVYVNSGNQLKCLAHLDPGMSGWNRWISVPFDNPRSSAVTPALVVFNGELKCVYVDGGTGKLVTLTYRPVIGERRYPDQKAGTWHEDSQSIPAMETETIALGQWNTPNGAMLVALGNKADNKDARLRYSSFSGATGWTKEVRVTALTSSNCPALAACGSSLYLFYRSADGTIASRVARQQAQNGKPH